MIVNNHIHDALHGVYVRQADGARIEGNTIVGTQTVEQPSIRSRRRAKPAEGELCEVTLNQNRRGNGIHIWNSSGHVDRAGTPSATPATACTSRSSIAARCATTTSQGVRYGLHYMYSDENRFEGNVFRDNAAGAALMSSHGIVLRRNRFLANQGHRSYGVLLQTVEDSTLEDNGISGNTVGVFFESGHGNRLRRQRDRTQPHRHPRLRQLRRQSSSRATASPGTSIRSRRPAAT